MAINAITGVAAAAAVTLSPIGSINGSFDCYNTRQLLSGFESTGFKPARVGEAGGAERFTLYEDPNGQFVITMEMPGMAAVCIVSQGKYKKPVGV
jgi:hypothetical protein